MNKISALQIVDPKHWSGLTRESHLGWLGMQEPEIISSVMNRLYELNVGTDNFVSFMNKLPTEYINDDVVYRWFLQGSDERSIPLVIATTDAAGATAVTDAAQVGLNRGIFYMWFTERYFEVTSHIVGNKPELYQLRVIADPVQAGNLWRYQVQLFTGDDTLWIPAADLARNTMWSELFGMVEQELSKRGNNVHHTAPYQMENVLSMIRKNYDVPGNMISKGKNKPLAFAFIDQNGKTQTRWIDKLGWDFYVQFERDKARLLAYGKSNKLSDGSYGHNGESGNALRSGFGMYEQMEYGNVLAYNTFSLDMLTDFAMDMSYGKIPEDKREFVISTGEYGAYQFHKDAVNKANAITYLQANVNIKTEGGKLTLDEGQFLNYAAVNGIKFKLTIDPMKDGYPNTMRHPDGGLASSYIYEIFDVGTTGGISNISKVSVKDEEEFFGYIPGLRDPFSPYNNRTDPRIMATSVDGYSVFKGFIGGVKITNPKKTARIIPSILRS
jgi:hypothetical protein